VLVEGLDRLLPPARDEVGVVAVGGDVDGVHRLPAGPLAGELSRQRGIGADEALVELGREGFGVECHQVDAFGAESLLWRFPSAAARTAAATAGATSASKTLGTM
jgi:hypothetical protein